MNDDNLVPNKKVDEDGTEGIEIGEDTGEIAQDYGLGALEDENGNPKPLGDDNSPALTKDDTAENGSFEEEGNNNPPRNDAEELEDNDEAA